MHGGAWQATVHGVAKSQTQLSDFAFTFFFFFFPTTAKKPRLLREMFNFRAGTET